MRRLLIALVALFGAANAAAQEVPPAPSDGVEAADGDDETISDDAPTGDDADPGADADPPEADAADPPEADAEGDAPKADAAKPDAIDGEAPEADDGDDADPEADADDGEDGDAEDAGDEGTGAKTPSSTDPLGAFRAGEYAKARDAWLDRLAERPGAPALHYRIAVSAALAEDPAIAEKHAATVERLDPGNLKAQELAAAARVARTRAAPLTLAVAQAEQALRDGRLRSADRLATAALAEEGADAGALHRIRGEALLALGRADEAANALERAAAAGHTDPRLWLALGDAAKSVGDKARASYLYTLAAQGAPLADPAIDAAHARRKALGKASSRTSKKTRRR